MLPRAKKSLGQNFLVEESYVRRIVEAVGPRAGETLVEIGPGRGALTGRLVERAGRVVAVEFDRELAAYLRGRFAAAANFELVEADALEVDFCAAVAPAASARVVANLPYNISTAVLQRLVAQRRCLPELVLMLQREVVERVTAPPGSPERGFLSVLVQAHCEAEALFDVPPGAFRPVPKVWSTVVRLRARERVEPGAAGEEFFRVVVGAGFAQRRKTILNNLRAAPPELRARVEAAGGEREALSAAGVEPQRRAETLTLEEWAALARVLEGAAGAT
ncbi:MAG TPA: 16S rRNA (adenine(1518)-N(6)/adenine(1519)-N(6))-dimethyltransferase RsmA [Pyrinomonadaceae bacterium]|nr:16S rRNA (adenine(1518)-N(6)/adenine(1519)-N(6))-dimethyltransferase RsmA [Pyrinomonadaceae bacterium]